MVRSPAPAAMMQTATAANREREMRFGRFMEDCAFHGVVVGAAYSGRPLCGIDQPIPPGGQRCTLTVKVTRRGRDGTTKGTLAARLTPRHAPRHLRRTVSHTPSKPARAALRL